MSNAIPREMVKKYIRDKEGNVKSCYIYDPNSDPLIIWEKQYYEIWYTENKGETESRISRREIFSYDENKGLEQEYTTADFSWSDMLRYSKNVKLNDRYSVIEGWGFSGFYGKSYLQELVFVETLPYAGQYWNGKQRVIAKFEFYVYGRSLETVIKFRYDKKDKLNLIRIDRYKVKHDFSAWNVLFKPLNWLLSYFFHIVILQLNFPFLIPEKGESQTDNLPNKLFGSSGKEGSIFSSGPRWTGKAHGQRHETVIAFPYLSGIAYEMRKFLMSIDQKHE